MPSQYDSLKMLTDLIKRIDSQIEDLSRRMAIKHPDVGHAFDPDPHEPAVCAHLGCGGIRHGVQCSCGSRKSFYQEAQEYLAEIYECQARLHRMRESFLRRKYFTPDDEAYLRRTVSALYSGSPHNGRNLTECQQKYR